MKKKNNLKIASNKIFLLLLIVFSMSNIHMVASVQQNTVLSDSVINELKNQKPYREYLEYNKPAKKESRIWAYFMQFLSKLFSNKVSYHFSNIIPYLILAAVIILIILKVNNLTLSGLIKPKNKTLKAEFGFDGETPIQTVRFKTLINNALNKQDYREAIRYSYLSLLQAFDEQEIIQWARQKSNYEYLFSTQNTNFYTEFKQIIQVYEDAWYGEIPWTDNEYKDRFYFIENSIAQIENKLKK